MSWCLPKEKTSIGLLLDAEQFNANVYAFASEIDGNLNEHNFTRFAASNALSAGNGSADVCLRLARTEGIAVAPLGASSTMINLIQSESWKPVAESLTTFNALGTKVVVWCSFQLYNPATFTATGLNFCLAVDDVPQYSSLLGSGDQSNDLIQSVRLSATTPVFDIGSGPGFLATQTPLVCRGHFTVPPGEHRIQLMYRNLATESAASVQSISQLEMIVLAMWA